jgi:hypothetical protein
MQYTPIDKPIRKLPIPRLPARMFQFLGPNRFEVPLDRRFLSRLSRQLYVLVIIDNINIYTTKNAIERYSLLS